MRICPRKVWADLWFHIFAAASLASPYTWDEDYKGTNSFQRGEQARKPYKYPTQKTFSGFESRLRGPTRKRRFYCSVWYLRTDAYKLPLGSSKRYQLQRCFSLFIYANALYLICLVHAKNGDFGMPFALQGFQRYCFSVIQMQLTVVPRKGNNRGILRMDPDDREEAETQALNHL